MIDSKNPQPEERSPDHMAILLVILAKPARPVAIMYGLAARLPTSVCLPSAALAIWTGRLDRHIHCPNPNKAEFYRQFPVLHATQIYVESSSGKTVGLPDTQRLLLRQCVTGTYCSRLPVRT